MKFCQIHLSSIHGLVFEGKKQPTISHTSINIFHVVYDTQLQFSIQKKMSFSEIRCYQFRKKNSKVLKKVILWHKTRKCHKTFFCCWGFILYKSECQKEFTFDLLQRNFTRQVKTHR